MFAILTFGFYLGQKHVPVLATRDVLGVHPQVGLGDERTRFQGVVGWVFTLLAPVVKLVL